MMETISPSYSEMTTEYFGKILFEECGIPSRKDDEVLAKKWDERVQKYKDRKEKMEAEEK